MTTTGESHAETESDPENELDRILEEGEEKGKKIAEIGRNLTEAGQSMADGANATRKVVHLVKTLPNIELLINDWGSANQQADLVIGQHGETDVLAFTSASGTAVSTSSDSFATLLSIVPKEERPRLATALESFNQVSERPAGAKEVEKLMESLKLDQAPPGRKSALEQFRTAQAAFKAPVSEGNPIATSLIPMRESIRTAIDTLLRRRPKQEKTKNECGKIVSIGRQLKRDGLPDIIVNSWAFQWTCALQTYLSPAKEEDISRDEWRRRLARSTLFLKGFLGGLDPSKLRT